MNKNISETILRMALIEKLNGEVVINKNDIIKLTNEYLEGEKVVNFEIDKNDNAVLSIINPIDKINEELNELIKLTGMPKELVNEFIKLMAIEEAKQQICKTNEEKEDIQIETKSSNDKDEQIKNLGLALSYIISLLDVDKISFGKKDVKELLSKGILGTGVKINKETGDFKISVIREGK